MEPAQLAQGHSWCSHHTQQSYLGACTHGPSSRTGRGWYRGKPQWQWSFAAIRGGAYAVRQGGLNCRLVPACTFLLLAAQSKSNSKPSEGLLLIFLTGSIRKYPALSPSLCPEAGG